MNYIPKLLLNSGSAGGHSSRTKSNASIAKQSRSVDISASNQKSIVDGVAAGANLSQQGFVNTWGSKEYEFPIKFGR